MQSNISNEIYYHPVMICYNVITKIDKNGVFAAGMPA